MERRGHAMPGVDTAYTHATEDMRQDLCDVVEDLWQTAVEVRRAVSARPKLPLLDRALNEKEGQRGRRS